MTERSGTPPTVTYIRNDIDCSFCLADVEKALIALSDVEDVEPSPGCLIVTHRGEVSQLVSIVREFGHRLSEADNGEMVMGPSSPEPMVSCDRHPPSIRGSQ